MEKEIAMRPVNHNTDLIPKELMKWSQWVAWDWRPRHNGKPRKIPIDPRSGHYASTTNPATWGSFKRALRAQKKLKLAGIGFVFTEDDPFVGIDIDDCRDLDTGKISDWALEIIKDVNSYSEVSPSGTGVKIFLFGHIPASVKARQVEIYDQKRFFTVTGRHLEGTPHNITDPEPHVLRDLLLKFHKQHSRPAVGDPMPKLRKEGEVVGSGTFSQLFAGDSSSFPSQSEADLALCRRLAILTNRDAQQIDALFRQSGLYREKWDRPYADGSTYGQRTIQKVLEQA